MSTYNDASLIYYPSGYKASKAYSLKPTDGSGDLTFTRASTATRVNEQGLIEGVRTNLVTYSEQFDNAAWGLTLSASIISNNVISPDGTLNADTLVAGVGGAQIQQAQIETSGVDYTVSMYMKRISGSGAVYLRAVENTNTPITITTEWTRVSLTVTSTSATIRVGVRLDISGDQVAIWGAMLEQSASATEYIPTTTTAVSVGMLANVPRIDYTGGGCAKLLLEPQRTNLWPYSRASLTWLKSFWTTTDNYALSPNGAVNAFRAVCTNNSGILYLNGIGTTGVNNTLSVYAKSNTGTNQNFRFFGNGNSITSGEFVATTEWQRFTFTYNCTNVTSGIKASAVMLSDLLFSDFQHEAGDYATSVIPTSGVAVTRVADSASKSGISSLIGQTEGTLFLDVKALGNDNTTRLISLSDGSFNNFIRFSFAGALNFATCNLVSSGTTQASNDFSLIQTNNNKIAIKYKTNLFQIYVNGVLIYQDLTVNTFSGTTLSSLLFSNPLGGDRWYGYLKSLQLYKTALTDEECINLTTL